MRNWTNEEIQRYLGTHQECYLTHAKDDGVRNGAASGGSTSAILIALLEQGRVDGALIWRMVCDQDEPVCEPFIATTREEVLSARGSKYTAINFPRQALPLIKGFDGKLAVLTLPCDASYLRRKIRVSPEIGETVACIVTLFCGHNSEPELTKVITRRHGMKWKDVKDFKYRTGSWRGRLTMVAHDGREVDIPTRTFTHYQNLHLFSERKCLNCTDHFGFDSDIATGDIWSLDAKKHKVKPTLVVARNARGSAFAKAALPALESEEVPASVVVGGNSRGMTYHYQISARARAAKRFGIKIKDPLRLPVTPLDELVATIGVFNYWWSHNEKYSHLIEKIPMKGIEAYIYFFKGLQQLNLFFYRPFPPTDKYSIVGARLSGDHGSEAALATVIGQLRARLPEARFVVHSPAPKRDRELCDDLGVDIVSATVPALVLQQLPVAVLDGLLGTIKLGVPRSWMPQAARELKEARVVLDLSGASVGEGDDGLSPKQIARSLPAMLLRAPVVRLARGLSGFESRTKRRLGSLMMRGCEKVFVRGARSLERLQSLGADAEGGDTADVGFLYEESFGLTRGQPERLAGLVAKLEVARQAQRPVLVVSASAKLARKSAKAGADYEHEMAAVVRHFLREGYCVVLMPFATTGRFNVRDDHATVEEIRSRVVGMDVDHLVCVTSDVGTAGSRRLLAKADFLLASHVQVVVAGLSLGVPTTAVGSGSRAAEVLARFGMADQAHDVTGALEHGLLIERVERLVQRGPQLQRRILENLEGVREAAAKQFEWLADFLAASANVCTPDEDAAAEAAAAPSPTASR